MQPGVSEDPDAALRALLARVVAGPGALDPELRRRAARGEALPEPLATFAAKLAAGALQPQDVEGLRRAGLSEDAVFDLAVATVLGWAKLRLDAGLAALERAEA